MRTYLILLRIAAILWIIWGVVHALADLGYLIFVDLGGYARFFPGTVMTMVSASAIILSFIAYFGSGRLENIQYQQDATGMKSST